METNDKPTQDNSRVSKGSVKGKDRQRAVNIRLNELKKKSNN